MAEFDFMVPLVLVLLLHCTYTFGPLVNTRCIYLESKKQSAADNIALAPMLDFLNHTHDAKVQKL